MKQLLDFPKAQRLAAYRRAGDNLLAYHNYSCIALNAALSRPGRVADVCPQFWHQLYDGDEHTVEIRHRRWSRYRALCRELPTTRLEADRLYAIISADSLNTRLMMLAWAHALDEAGDLEKILT